jgi:hypothetical protein
MAVMARTIIAMPLNNRLFFPASSPTAHPDLQCRSDTIQAYSIWIPASTTTIFLYLSRRRRSMGRWWDEVQEPTSGIGHFLLSMVHGEQSSLEHRSMQRSVSWKLSMLAREQRLQDHAMAHRTGPKSRPRRCTVSGSWLSPYVRNSNRRHR